jgi:hypothetical protein
MQVLNIAAFDKRVIYNAAKMYSNQLGRLSSDRLEALSDAIFEFNDLEDLAQWLRENSIG